MRVPFYKSLDRDLELIKIRGRWVVVVGVGAGVCIVLGFVAGAVFGTGMGLAVAIVGTAVVFFGCVTLQVKVPSRQLPKVLLEKKISGWVIRRETISRILLPDKEWEKYSKIKFFKGSGQS